MVFDVIRTGTANYANAVTSVEFLTHYDIFGDDPPAFPGDDYSPTAGTLVFGAGVTALQVTVPILPDEIVEDDEAVVLQIHSATGPAGTVIADTEGVGFIEDDDNPSLFRLIGADAVGEGGTLEFVVTRSGGAEALGEAAALDIQTRANSVPAQTATPGEDFVATSARLTFAPGESQKTFAVQTLNDLDAKEGDEIVQVRILNPENGSILTGQGIKSGTILDVPLSGKGEGLDIGEILGGADAGLAAGRGTDAGGMAFTAADAVQHLLDELTGPGAGETT